jgi:predicted transcriptional regulator
MARSKWKWNEIDNTNDVWDLVEIPNGTKIVGCNGSTSQMWLQREYKNISISTNNILGSRINSYGAKIVGCDGSTRQNVTLIEIWKAIKSHLSWNVLREENE